MYKIIMGDPNGNSREYEVPKFAKVLQLVKLMEFMAPGTRLEVVNLQLELQMIKDLKEKK